MKLTETELREHIRLRLETRRGEFPWNPSFGSDLWRLGRAKNTDDVLAMADKCIREALQPEIDDGNIDKIERIEIYEQTTVGFKLRVTLTANQEQLLSVDYDSVEAKIIPKPKAVC